MTVPTAMHGDRPALGPVREGHPRGQALVKRIPLVVTGLSLVHVLSHGEDMVEARVEP